MNSSQQVWESLKGGRRVVGERRRVVGERRRVVGERSRGHILMKRNGKPVYVGCAAGREEGSGIPTADTMADYDSTLSAASLNHFLERDVLSECDVMPKRRKGSLIRKWLPGSWGGKTQRKNGVLVQGAAEEIPYANQLGLSSYESEEDVMMCGDGMAATTSPAHVSKMVTGSTTMVMKKSVKSFAFSTVGKSRNKGVVHQPGTEDTAMRVSSGIKMTNAEMGTRSAQGCWEGTIVSETVTTSDVKVVQSEEGRGMVEERTRRTWRRRSRKTSENHPVIDTPPIKVNHETLRLIRERITSGSKPIDRKDPFKLGLVVEGGGMRGCVSGGALQALTDLGLNDAFDAVYGSSAGAINGTYFLSGQRNGVDIYHQHIASPEFIDLKRLLSRKPGTPAALNLEYLLDHVIHHVLPLDFDAVLRSPIPLKVIASSLDTLSPIVLQDFQHKEDMIECLRASANVPEVAGGPVHHRGHRLVDAAVFEAVPFRSAIADGCTHVLVLCTRPAPLRKSALDKALSDAIQTAIKKAVMNPDYMVDAWKASVKDLMADGLSHDDMLLRSLDEDSHTQPWFNGTHVFPIYPSSHASSFSPLCTDVPTLKSGVAEGRRAVLAVARAALGDAVDLSLVPEMNIGRTNIVPSTLKGKKQKNMENQYVQSSEPSPRLA